MSSNNFKAIVLAAGLGVRMKSSIPKVLHRAAGRSMIDYVISALRGAGASELRLVVGHGAEALKKHLNGEKGVLFFSQSEQLGTADAVKAADVSTLRGTVVICNGDHPLILKEDLSEALDAFKKLDADLLVVSAVVKKSEGFGRIVRGAEQKLQKIVEEKDASLSEKKINEINSGIYIAKAEVLQKLLPLIKNQNAKKEFYLTDLVRLAAENKLNVQVCKLPRRVARGVNDQWELSLASKALFARNAKNFARQGVVILDPANTYIESTVRVGAESVIHPGTMLLGSTTIGRRCLVESNCQINDAQIADDVQIRWGSLIEKSEVSTRAIVGPYARLRPETVVGEEAHVGNFVELKKTTLGARSKANHITYLGDAEIGEDTNIGCGTITCNYAPDKKKYKTKIGNKVFVGSDSQFVAPVTVGDHALIASGSTITKDVPARSLAFARSRQINKSDYNKE